MHPRQVIAVGVLLCALASGAFALEAVTRSNDRASNAALVRRLAAERADHFADLSAVEAQVNALLTCTGKGKFYAPGQTGADADGCTEIQVTIIE
jgi:hypothetical protein